MNKKQSFLSVLLRLRNFLVVGGCAFVVDLGCYVLLQSLDIEHRIARLVAYVIATWSAWYMNRHFTFFTANKNTPLQEMSRYYLMACGAFILNYGFYFISTSYIYFFQAHTTIAFLIGVILAMVYNFAVANLFVYRQR